MFWNLIVQKYEKYHLCHIVMLIVIAIYSLLGALCFCALEAPHERSRLAIADEAARRRSALARDRLIYDLQFFFIRQVNVSRLLSSEFNKTLDYYDRLIGVDGSSGPSELRWNIWGGLYFAGTVYTTIGYGDIVTETVAGKIFTVFYAIVGIPLLITVLNIWGNGLFQLMQYIWRKYFLRIRRAVKLPHLENRRRHRKFDGDDDEDNEFINEKDVDDSAPSDDSASKLPVRFAAALLIGWICGCAAILCLVEKWAFFEAAYFFFISLTTIGIGDSIANHKVTCIYFLLILIGLAVVSMSISVIQLKIEILFAQIVKSIDNDFKSLLIEKLKYALATSIGDERKISANTIAVNVPRASVYDIGACAVPLPDAMEQFAESSDALQKYASGLSFTDRILARMMSHHQRKMLNEKLNTRRNVRSVAVQTQTGRSSVFSQTEQELQAASVGAAAATPYYSTSEESSEEESATPGPINSFAAMMAAAAAAGRRSGSTGPTVGQRVNAPAGTAGATTARRGVLGTTPVTAASAAAPSRHHRPKGLSRKKLYIYNIGD